MENSRQEQNLFLERKRREGIYDDNLKAPAEEKELMCERQQKLFIHHARTFRQSTL
jgi:hypothetical protein